MQERKEERKKEDDENYILDVERSWTLAILLQVMTIPSVWAKLTSTLHWTLTACFVSFDVMCNCLSGFSFYVDNLRLQSCVPEAHKNELK